MKKFSQYIKEALRPEVTKWISSLYDKMINLVKEKKINTELEVDVKKLSKPEKGGFMYDDFASDKTIKNFINNNIFGFTVINQMIKTPNKYLINEGDTNEEIKPECLPYWYQTDSNIYWVGLILWDNQIKYEEDYANLVAIESSLLIKKSLPLLKGMLNDFTLHYLSKKGNYKGLVAKPIHPKMRSILLKLGFIVNKDNKNILLYKL